MPNKLFEESLRALQVARDELAALDDEIRGQIGAIEQQLASFRIGVSFSVEIDRAEHEVVKLLYTKSGGSWGLYLQRHYATYANNKYETTRLIQCSREERARVVEFYLKVLLVEAEAVLRKAIKERQGAIKSGTEIIDQLAAATAPLGHAPRTQPKGESGDA